MLDENVQKKLKEELAELRKQEKDVQKQIALALEKENLERESSSWLSKDKGQSSQLLQQELDRVKTLIEKYNRRDMASFPEVVKARQAVVQCYRYVSSTCLTYSDHAGRTLDCWKEVEQFKNAFAEAEKVRCRGASANLHRNLWLHGSNIVCLASIAALTSPARPLPAVDRPPTLSWSLRALQLGDRERMALSIGRT